MTNRAVFILALALIGLCYSGRTLLADEAEDRAKRQAEERMRYMQEWDRNKDGMISPDEVPERGRSLDSFRRRLEVMGVDPDRPVSLEKYVGERTKMDIAEARGEEYQPTRRVDPEMAFGATEPAGKAPGFDEPITAEEKQELGIPSQGDVGEGGNGSRQVRAADDRVKKYAKGLIDRYDSNKNGIIEGDESREIRGGAERYDGNKDGKITYDELVLQLSGNSSGSSSSGASERRDDRGDRERNSDRRSERGRDRSTRGSDRRDEERTASSSGDDRKSYRFTPAIEMLPKGTPSWFIDKDDNEDGQVAMAEYASSWSSSRVREFQAYDHNGDGIITAEEAIHGKR